MRADTPNGSAPVWTTAIRDGLRTAAKTRPLLKRSLLRAETGLGMLTHSAAQIRPAMIKAAPRRLTVAITAHCNLRCSGCRYGRDFMTGHQLPLHKVLELLDDAKTAGIELVRLYGGEPLLHPDLPQMIEHASHLGLSTYITTNGILLKQKIDRLFEAGLRNISIGFYGTAQDYNKYVHKTDAFRRLTEGLAYARARYGDKLSLQLNYLIMRPSCSASAVRAAGAFAEQYNMTLHTDLIHYSLPYFTEGADQELQFTAEDGPMIAEVVDELLALKKLRPGKLMDSVASIRSIPDWLLKKADMRIPCDAGKLLWVGADGSVQLCYVTFKLGNIFQTRLRDIVFSDAHHQAARDAFLLKCPNCHCERNSRIQKHLPSILKYSNT